MCECECVRVCVCVSACVCECVCVHAEIWSVNLYFGQATCGFAGPGSIWTKPSLFTGRQY